MQKTNEAFTIAEIMIVVIIIALLAIIAVPAYQSITERSREAKALNSLRQFVSGGRQYMFDEGQLSANFTNIVPIYVPTFPQNHTSQLETQTVDGAAGAHTVTLTIGGSIITLSYQ